MAKKKKLTHLGNNLVKRNMDIAEKRTQGMSYQEIADYYGLNKSTICLTLQKENIREILDTAMSQIVMMVPVAVDGYFQLLNDPETDGRLKKDIYRDIMSMVGIVPGHTVNHMLVNVYNTQVNTLSPEVAKAISGTLDSRLSDSDAEVIDADFE